MRRIQYFALLLALTAGNAVAGDVAKGEKLYMGKGCIGCHGPAGKSPNPATFPSTAGLEAAYTIEQLKAFKSGERKNAMMSPMVATLNEDDMQHIAAYLAAQK